MNIPMKLIGIVVAFVLATIFTLSGIVHQDAQEMLVAQSPTGAITVYKTPGWHFVPFSKTTMYPKRSSYEFKTPIRFNDGGQAMMTGSIQYEIPTDEKALIDLHSKYGSAEALNNQLVSRVVDKAIFMSGPLMSSRESYAEKKPKLVNDVEDQITHGIFMTRQKDTKMADPITGIEKTVTIVDTVLDDKGLPRRQEDPILAPFGIRTFNFTIAEIDYDKTIEAQIRSQQQITMDVQTAIADAKKAEQEALTVAKQGEAAAAKSKWEQEVLKAKAVTLARQQLEVAELATKEAEQFKQQQILKADGEAEYKRRIMLADGALQQKLAAWVQVQSAYAKAIGEYKGQWVPTTVLGGSTTGGAGNTNGAQTLVDMLTAKTARDLSLDMSVPEGNSK